MRRLEIEDLSRKVNVLLTPYVEVHNGIYRRSWWQGLFKPIPFQEHEVKISAVEAELKQAELRAADLRHGATSIELWHVGTLHKYVAALLVAVVLLHRIIIALKAKSEKFSH